MERVVEERAALAQQSVINPPRVDSDAVQLAAVDRAHESERLLHLQPEPRHVPMQLSVIGRRFVRKSVNLLDRQHVRLQAPDQGPAALGAEVKSKIGSISIH